MGVVVLGWCEPVAAAVPDGFPGVVFAGDLPSGVVDEHVVVPAEEDPVGGVGAAPVPGPVVDDLPPVFRTG